MTLLMIHSKYSKNWTLCVTSTWFASRCL